MEKKTQDYADMIVEAYKEATIKHFKEYIKAIDEGIPTQIVQIKMIRDMTEHFVRALEILIAIKTDLKAEIIPDMSPQDIADMYKYYMNNIQIPVLKQEEKQRETNRNHS